MSNVSREVYNVSNRNKIVMVYVSSILTLSLKLEIMNKINQVWKFSDLVVESLALNAGDFIITVWKIKNDKKVLLRYTAMSKDELDLFAYWCEWAMPEKYSDLPNVSEKAISKLNYKLNTILIG